MNTPDDFLQALADEIRPELAKLGRKRIHVYCDKQPQKGDRKHRVIAGGKPIVVKPTKLLCVRVVYKGKFVAQIGCDEKNFYMYYDDMNLSWQTQVMPGYNWRDFPLCDPNTIDGIINILRQILG